MSHQRKLLSALFNCAARYGTCVVVVVVVVVRATEAVDVEVCTGELEALPWSFSSADDVVGKQQPWRPLSLSLCYFDGRCFLFFSINPPEALTSHEASPPFYDITYSYAGMEIRSGSSSYGS